MKCLSKISIIAWNFQNCHLKKCKLAQTRLSLLVQFQAVNEMHRFLHHKEQEEEEEEVKQMSTFSPHDLTDFLPDNLLISSFKAPDLLLITSIKACDKLLIISLGRSFWAVW